MQCRRVYEILRLRVTDLSNAEEYKSFRLGVKNRLNVPFQVCAGSSLVPSKVAIISLSCSKKLFPRLKVQVYIHTYMKYFEQFLFISILLILSIVIGKISFLCPTMKKKTCDITAVVKVELYCVMVVFLTIFVIP